MRHLRGLAAMVLVIGAARIVGEKTIPIPMALSTAPSKFRVECAVEPPEEHSHRFY